MGLDDVGITGVGDGQTTDAEVFTCKLIQLKLFKEPSQPFCVAPTLSKVLTASGSELDVVALVVVDSGLGQHGVVLDLGAAELGGVVGQNDQLGLALAELANGLPVAQVVLARLDHQLETGVDGGTLLLGLLRHHIRNLRSDF